MIYSTDGVVFRFETLQEAAEAAFSGPGGPIAGVVVTLWLGELTPTPLSHYLSSEIVQLLAEDLAASAESELGAEEVSLYGDGWAVGLRHSQEALMPFLKSALDEFAVGHNLCPPFGRVKTAVEVTVRYSGEDWQRSDL
jgi:hypothetical protein